MADAFDTPQEVQFDHDLPDERGRWGWYRLLHPETMNAMTVRRASSFGDVLGDRTALEKWKERMSVVGMSQRPDLMALVHGKDVKRDSKELNGLIDDAKKSAGSNKAANLGTAIHGYCEQIDCGRWTLDDVPEQHRADVKVYMERLSEAGVTPIPSLIERITYVPELDVAGKFDRIFRLPDGSYVIGDLKTGSVEYSWMEIGIQLALYANGVNSAGVWDKREKIWTHDVTVRTDIAIVMHLPVGKSECTLYTVDIEQGWRDAQLCAEVYKARKVKERATPFGDAATLPSAPQKPVQESTWTDRFNAVQSREQASELYQEARKVIPKMKLDFLVQLAQYRLKNLGL